jgi:hypothetical protein
MRVENSSDELILRDSPGCMWIFGSFFAIIGAIFVYGSLGGFSNWDEVPRYAIYLSFLMGSIAIAVGVWQIGSHPLSKVIINPQVKTVVLSKRGLFAQSETTFHFEEIRQFIVSADKDDEDNPIWKIALFLNDGETIEITSAWSRDEKECLQTAQKINQFMSKPQIYASERRQL